MVILVHRTNYYPLEKSELQGEVEKLIMGNELPLEQVSFDLSDHLPKTSRFPVLYAAQDWSSET